MPMTSYINYNNLARVTFFILLAHILSTGRLNGDALTLFEIIYNISKDIFIPLTVGGGIRSVKDGIKLLENGLVSPS